MITIDLTGKTALVSGGSRGIGSAISRCLAQAGAEVWLNHRPLPESAKIAGALVKKISRSGGIAREIGADVTNESEVNCMVDTILKESKKIDILVCNAGSTFARTLSELTSQEWESTQRLNLTQVFYLTRRVVPAMAVSGGGSVILIGSAGVRYGGGGGVHYASSKSALSGFMIALSREYISQKVRVNIIHPSLVDTELLRKRYATEEDRKKLIKRVPLGRLSRPEDIGYLTTFLVSDLASYITCQETFVDGGMTIPFQGGGK